jgi:hypothetical protein
LLLWAREGSWDSIGLGWLPGGLMETTCAVGVGGSPRRQDVLAVSAGRRELRVRVGLTEAGAGQGLPWCELLCIMGHLSGAADRLDR